MTAGSVDKLKVAIVCDWLTTMGGAERVVLELHKMFPKAPIYTSSYSPERMPLFKDADVHTGFIQILPYSTKHQLWPVLRRHYFERLELDEYDLVISSSGAEAKAVKVTKGIHINYCHSPTQYYWVRPDEYMSANTAGGIGLLNPVWRFGLKLLKPWMKRWDYLAAQKPDYILANSTAVKERIDKFYNRDSKVVYPPVDIERFKTDDKIIKRSGLVIAGRQVHHKRFDLAVQACSELGVELRVIGDGPEHERLKSMAGSTIKFLGRVSDEELIKQFQSAEGYIFPQEDDFGIVAVEAMAAGTPVVAYKAGGALDTVEEGKTGVFFEKQSVSSLSKAILRASKENWDYNGIAKNAAKFSSINFETELRDFITQLDT